MLELPVSEDSVQLVAVMSSAMKSVVASLLVKVRATASVPVVAPLAISREGEALNVDGDRAAAAIGQALKADCVVILTNVPGLLRDFPDESSLIRFVPADRATEYLERYAKGRMKRKLLGAVEAVSAGVGRVIIADGRTAQPIHRALRGYGTVIA